MREKQREKNMGYFSELTIGDDYRDDYSYPSPEWQLRWRIEDLLSRLEDISKGDHGIIASYHGGCQYSKEDIAYAPPECFFREDTIIAAIAMAKRKLALLEAEDTKLHAREDAECVDRINAEISRQLCIWDLLHSETPVTFDLEMKQAA